MTPGELLKQARRRHGVSQGSLAVRAGTTQSAISRIERDRSFAVESRPCRELLFLLGEDLGDRLALCRCGTAGIDRTLDRVQRLALHPGPARRRRGMAFADVVATVTGAGRQAVERRMMAGDDRWTTAEAPGPNQSALLAALDRFTAWTSC